jgi:hypothetical protein
MRAPIIDQFTDLPISRQRKYQLRKALQGRCTECGKPALTPDGSTTARCLKHMIEARERQRVKRGAKRRYWGTLSYRLQKREGI